MNIAETIINAKKSDAYIKLKSYYEKKSYMHIIGTARSELAHSNFIAWLLNKKSEHNLEYYPVKKLLNLIAICREHNKDDIDIQSDLLKLFVNDSIEILNEIVSVEKQITIAGESKRLDIEILLDVNICNNLFKLPIIIENKVNSLEHNDQTIFYKKWAQKEYNNSDIFLPSLLIYLTPKNYDKPKCKDFIVVNYQDLTNYVIEPSLKKCTDLHSVMVIKDYLRCLTFTSLDDKDTDKNNKNKGDIIMAYSEEEKKLLHEFWDNNKDLIYAVAESLSEEEKADSKIETILKSVSSKDYSKYCYRNSIYNKTNFVYEVLKDYINDNSVNSYKELIDVFDDKIVKLAKDVKDPTRFNKTPITLKNGDIVYISNQIGITETKKNLQNINYFCEKISTLGIQYSKI
ncbi:MAG: PD-(D/E)XK nuclease family protein [Coprobacillus sp.]|nr:PD-(D/E)XK nuclease family protein [Coprobacillus sp.]